MPLLRFCDPMWSATVTSTGVALDGPKRAPQTDEDAWVSLGEPLVAEVPTLQGSGKEVRDDDVGRIDEELGGLGRLDQESEIEPPDALGRSFGGSGFRR